MSKLLITAILFCLIHCKLQAEGLNFYASGRLQTAKDSGFSSEKKHSPSKASIFSAVLPGLGQAYNGKYWKIPIIYAALSTSGYFFVYNRKEMKRYQTALNAYYDGDSNTKVSSDLSRFSTDVLKAQRNYYRTNRDYSIIVFTGFYILNIIDATVDAHFYKFNIDKPLAAQKHKRWNIYSCRIGNNNAIGLSWKF